jgi:transcriptional regulator with XRE-family HTH domain
MSAGDPLEVLAGNLASNLRFLRQRRGLTQNQLARLCGVPRSTIAQVETGSANPTLAVLARLALALQLGIEELLSAPHPGVQLFPKGSLPASERGRGGLARVQKLLPDPIPGMEMDRLELLPGARMTGVPHRPGTREYLACERGRLTLWVSGRRLDLAPGDVAAFHGDQPHSYHNESDAPAVGFSVVTLAPLPAASPRDRGGAAPTLSPAPARGGAP